MAADTPDARRQRLRSRIAESRRSGEAAVFEADGFGVEYADRAIKLELEAAERDRLEELLSEYRVFKIKQPDTRKANGGVVYLSAVTDAKHAADFIESLFREVYELAEGYELRELHES